MKNLIQAAPADLLCFSHLRWNFVYQRPQHLMNRFANYLNVYYIEEPIFDAQDEAHLSLLVQDKSIVVVVPHLPQNLSVVQQNQTMTALLDELLEQKNINDFAFWYYSPMALSFTEKYMPRVTLYDCMDELSAFKNAPKELKNYENRLLKSADIVFTGGYSLYEAKKNQHHNIYAFPSSIEKEHFRQARIDQQQPEDQRHIKGTKLGFYGVIDERFDIDLIKGIAEARPDWQIVLLGPVVKIDPATLPQNSNIHYLGQKNYQELPSYLSGWDIALIPFALNESTRFISPTKTPEYLSAGIPVVSTAIKDVVNPYGDQKLVYIGATSDDFVAAIEQEMAIADKSAWLARVDKFLADKSWDQTAMAMMGIIKKAATQNLSIAS